MHEIHDSIMEFFVQSLTQIYHLLEYGTKFLIGIVSWQPWQANGVIIWPWKALKPSFQFSTFLAKTQVLFFVYGAAGRLWGVGFASIYTCEWLGLRKLIKESLNWWYNIWFFMLLFFQSFSCKLSPNHVQSPRYFPNLIIHKILRLFYAQKDSKG